MDKWDGELFLKALDLDSRKTVLEIGCGSGRITQKILDRYNRYVGIDLSPKTIQWATQRFKNHRNTSFICGDFLTYPFEDSFDIVLSTLTFMHIKEKRLALEKVFKVLKRGGNFVLSIDKNQTSYIDTGYSKITVFPDNPKDIQERLSAVGFFLLNVWETEFAYIFKAVKK